MKIALVANTSRYLENFRGGLIRRLLDLQHEVLFLAPEDEATSRLQDIGGHWRRLRFSSKSQNPLGDLLLLWQLGRIFHKEAPDLVFLFTIKPNIYGGLACQLLRCVYIPTITGLGTAFIHQSLTTRLVEVLYRISMRSARQVFFQNASDRSLFETRRLVSHSRGTILPGSGVDTRAFFHVPLEKRVGNNFVFLMIARLLRDKGVVEYFQAAEEVRRVLPTVRCLLLGSLETDNPTAITRTELENLLGLGAVEYLGTSNRIHEQISNSDCVVLPSYREGLSRVLLEAGAVGRPAITTNVPGCRDVIVHKETGLICRPKDSTDLALKMIELVSTPKTVREDMGRLARAKVEQEFDSRLVEAHYVQVAQTAGIRREAFR